MPAQPFLERPSFQKVWKKYHILVYFFEKNHLSFFVYGIRSYFREKEISSFPDNTKNFILQRNFFWKEHLFRTSGKRKYCFPCSVCIEVSRKFYTKACLLFNCFLVLVIKGILKALFSFIPRLLNFSGLPNYGSNSKKRYALRLLLKYLVRSTLHPIGGKVP